MKSTVRLAFLVAVIATLAACSQVAPNSPSLGTEAVNSQGSVRTLSPVGSATFQMTTLGTPNGIQSPEVPTFSFEHDVGTAGLQTQGLSRSGPTGRFLTRAPAKTNVPITPPTSSSATFDGLTVQSAPSVGQGLGISFQGLDAFHQRYADGGNQFSLEPPDQGLCAGPNHVLEAVNNVLQVYGKDGSPQGVVSLNQFFFNDHQLDRSTFTFGHFISDPSCLYDSSTRRWFLVILTLDVNPNNGAFLGSNQLDIATSKTSDPLGAWSIYSLDVTNDGGATYNLGDYPHFAVNADGVFITTDSFSLFGSAYYGAWLYGIQKSALVNGTTANVYATPLSDATGSSYSVAPAIATGTPQSGVEYMMSSSTADTSSASTIAVWAVTNTGSLDTATPDLHVATDLVSVGGRNGLSSGSYGDPPYYLPQKAGNVPLGDSQSPPQSEGPIAANWSGMKQAVFANGQIYSALTTVADNGAGPGGGPGAGAAWFDVVPRLTGNGHFAAQLARAGLVAPQGQNVIFPAITVTPSGRGAITATLVGPNDYPSAAVIPFTNGNAGAPSIVMAGVGPQDGFTEYGEPSYGPRWGDYGAAVVDPQGNIWLASEAIHQTCTLTEYTADPTCGGTRAPEANWSTQITEVTPNR